MSVILYKMTFKKRFFKCMENVRDTFIDFELIELKESGTVRITLT